MDKRLLPASAGALVGVSGAEVPVRCPGLANIGARIRVSYTLTILGILNHTITNYLGFYITSVVWPSSK